MRVTKEKAAENRARILAAAARLFRERGLSGVGVDALGEAAGMTHGSLYSQFGSKEGLPAGGWVGGVAPPSPARRAGGGPGAGPPPWPRSAARSRASRRRCGAPSRR